MDIRELDASAASAAVAVINAAAEWYEEFLPADELDGPEMTVDEWLGEGRRMTWYGAFEGAQLLGVMGAEHAGDAVLFRHAYVLPGHQRRGVATALHTHAEQRVHGVDRIIVGTYRANHKARAALEAAGYRPSDDPEAVLRRYYDIPEERLVSSLTYEKALR